LPWPPPVRALRALIPALALMAFAAAPAGAQTAREYAVKASFIAKFVAFVKWPAAAERGPVPGSDPDSGVFQVAVFGPNPFHEELETALRKAAPVSLPIRVRTAHDVKELAGSKLIFIGEGEKERLGKVVAWARAHGALTVGDGEGFAGEGVIINFYLSGAKVRFEINPSEAERSGFQISSLLLKVARIVEDE